MPPRDEPTARPLPSARPERPGLPLAWTLAVLMTALLAAAVLALLLGAHDTLVESSERNMRLRLDRASRELAALSEQASAPRVRQLAAVASDTTVRRLLRARAATDVADAAPRRPLDVADTDDSVPALARALVDSNTTTVELWDAAGARVAWVGDDVPAAEHPPVPGTLRDSAWFSPMSVVRGAVYAWTAVPVDDDGQRLGFVAYRRRLRGSPQTARRIRELTGEEVTLRLRNADHSVWVNVDGTVAARPARRDSGSRGVTYTGADGERSVATEAAIRRTPWYVVIEAPERLVIERPMRTVKRLALLGLAVVAVGALVAWELGRRLTQPLVALTAAAEEVAHGTYDHPVVADRGDELGRLGSSFDAMARQVASARQELERRAADAQAYAEQLARANARLREAIADAERARADAEDARSSAESASRAKSDFLAVMSHELRTPLNAIGGYTDLLALGIYGEPAPEQRTALERIAASQRHLLGLIEEVLSFARLEGGTVRFDVRDVPLAAALDGVESLVAPQARSRGVTLVREPCTPDLVVRADADKLRQVVLNLLANAVKYTPDGGRILLGCDADAGEVRVHVRDTGPGIPAERLDVIFEPFVQGDRALNRPVEGVGLGLAISRDLARGMGGALTVASELGHGSVFTVTLPRVARTAGAADATDDDARAVPSGA